VGRIFTPYEANRTLPLVRSIVADILACGRAIRERAEGVAGEASSNELRERLRDLLGELGRIGCEYKDWDFERGLIDFPGEVDGVRVLLCWRSDEPAVAHYHGHLDGYAGRRPIPERLLAPRAPVGTARQG
jgi:hypothetical protein